MYYPLKPTENIYMIDCDLYKDMIWALTVEDVAIFLNKHKDFSVSVQSLSPNNEGCHMKEGALVILGVKDGHTNGDYELAKFGGWLETAVDNSSNTKEDSPKSDETREEETVPVEIKDTISEDILYVAFDWDASESN